MIKGIQHLFRKGITALSGSGWSYFDATTHSTTRSYIHTRVADAKDTFSAWDRTTLLGLARRLKENVGFVKGAIADIRKFSIGEGIKHSSLCSDESLRDAYDAYFDAWLEIGEVTQKFDGRKIDCLLSEAIDTDGDSGIILTETSGAYPMIQVIEGHCIGGGDTEKGYHDGVKLNSVGRPVAYSVRTQIKEEEEFSVIPARDFIHVYEPNRFSGVRGITALAHGIDHIRDKKDAIALLKLGIKLDSAMGVAIIGNGNAQPTFGRQSQVNTAASGATGAAAHPDTFEKMQGGAIFKLEKGMDVKAITSERPSPNVQTFLSYIDRDVATGLEVPIEFVWDSSSLSGTGNRLIIKKAERKFFERQSTLIKVKRRIRNYVIAKAINRGDLPYCDDWWKCRFQTPSRISVDIGREARENREDVIAGLRTMQEDYGERGGNLYDARDDIQAAADDLCERASELVAKYKDQGLTFSQAIEMMEKRGNSGSPPSVREQSNKGDE